MSLSSTEYYYWDSSVFLAFLKGEVGRADIIQCLLEEVSRSRSLMIATSTQTIVEVVFATKTPKPTRLTLEQEEKIDDLLLGPLVRMVEVTPRLYFEARALMRKCVDNEWSLRANDAVQLATAAWLQSTQAGGIRAIHTYDEKWPKFSSLVDSLPISQPYLPQPPLPFVDG